MSQPCEQLISVGGGSWKTSCGEPATNFIEEHDNLQSLCNNHFGTYKALLKGLIDPQNLFKVITEEEYLVRSVVDS